MASTLRRITFVKTHRTTLKMSIFFTFICFAFTVSTAYAIPRPFKNLPKRIVHQLTHNKLTDTIRKRNLQSFKPPQYIRSTINPAHLINALTTTNHRALIADAASSSGQPVIIEAGHVANKLPNLSISSNKLFISSHNQHRNLFK